MAKGFTITEFFRRFPDDDTCLDHLMKVRYGETLECPKCGKEGRFARLRKLPAYACPWCGHHIHPMQGTPFERARTPLQKWFYAMYLFTTTRNGVAAKELQRQLGVTYKTAWRMGHEIRKYMGWVDGDSPLGGSGVVEADHTFIGGKRPMEERFDNKTVILGMVERKGEVITRVVRGQRFVDTRVHVMKNVVAGARIATDEGGSFTRLKSLGYDHQSVNHAQEEWVRGSVHTNTIEGFWSWLKRGINGTHVWVSQKHMAKYLGEFEYRFNLRHSPHLMFDYLLLASPRP